MKILITSGGTTEKIDEVRSISNNSTGMLGKAIAEAFSSLELTEKIFYLAGKTAQIPDSSKTEVIRTGSVAELETAIKNVLSNEQIDAIVHCMAVGDYRVKKVTTTDLVANAVCDKIFKDDNYEESIKKKQVIIKNAIRNAETLSVCSKLSSDIEDLVVILEKTPKVISSFKKLAPTTLLVGFKLLNNVSNDELIAAGYNVLVKNDCDFVLANDLKEISEKQHIGYLIDKNKAIQKLATKKEIANKIAFVISEKIVEG